MSFAALWFGSIALALACGWVADYVLPRIPGFDEWADKFPCSHYDDEI